MKRQVPNAGNATELLLQEGVQHLWKIQLISVSRLLTEINSISRVQLKLSLTTRQGNKHKV